VNESRHFALIVLVCAAVLLVTVFANLITERLRVPVPLIVLAGAAVTVQVVPAVHAPSEHVVEQILTVALICILFDGGMHIGVRRLRPVIGAVAIIGILGTFFTAAAGAGMLHWCFGLGWYPALLVATAVAPTDPAVVFSVLGKRQIAGPSSAILEGESGANDPVGIALMASLLAAGAVSWHVAGHVGLEFLAQMVVGLGIGLLGGRALLWFVRWVPPSGQGLYLFRTLAAAGAVYAIATVAHGSGFLAVFIAGIVIGDEHLPEIKRFHGALAGLGEVVAFVVLGLTVSLDVLVHRSVWLPGLVLALVIGFVARPLLVGLCLLPARLTRHENAFVLFAGLKGAVPLLLGEQIIGRHLHAAPRLYGIVVVVVAFSVLVQGSLTPAAARVLKIAMRTDDS
jgi:cell volume regulation protein A